MDNKICKLFGIEYPIIQEPTHTLTNGKMIAAVSESGALGILGINSGYVVNDANSGASTTSNDDIGDIKKFSILDTMTERNLMNEQIDSALENTFRPFAVEVASDQDKPQNDPTATAIVELMRKRRITIALFEGFNHLASPDWIHLLHSNGIRVIEKVNTLQEAKLALNTKCDCLICTNLDLLVPIIKISADTPVIAGGDLTDPKDIKKTLLMGADGVFISTLFNVSQEALTDSEIKNKIINSSNNDLVSIKMNNQIIYSLPGKLPNQLAQMTKSNVDSDKIFNKANRYQGLINGMGKGDLYTGYTKIAKNIDTITTSESIENIVANISKYLDF